MMDGKSSSSSPLLDSKGFSSPLKGNQMSSQNFMPPVQSRRNVLRPVQQESASPSFLKMGPDSSPIDQSDSTTFRQNHHTNDSSSSSGLRRPSKYEQSTIDSIADLTNASSDGEDDNSKQRKSSRGAKLGKQMGLSTKASSSAIVTPKNALESTEDSIEKKITPNSASSSAQRSNAAIQTTENRDKSHQKTKSGQLSDETIAELGAVPGAEPHSLLNSNGQPLSSKNILTIALQKAQSAVLLDSSNKVTEAIIAYKQAVRLLEEVVERVSAKESSKTSSRKSNREEERRRLKVIHDTYADRIRLLSMIHSPVEGEELVLGDEIQREDNSKDFANASINAPTNATSAATSSQTIAAPIINISQEATLESTPVRSLHPGNDEEENEDDDLVAPATPYFDVDSDLGHEKVDEPIVARKHLQESHPRKYNGSPFSKNDDKNNLLLVSPSTSTGSISQRRRKSDANDDGAQFDLQLTPTMASAAAMAAAIQNDTENGKTPQLRQGTNSQVQTSPPINRFTDEDARHSARSAERDNGRKRAASQPGSRRPSIPNAFLNGHTNNKVSAIMSSTPPPIPRITRKGSMPLPFVATQTPNTTTTMTTSGIITPGSAFPLPSPAPSTHSGYHTLQRSGSAANIFGVGLQEEHSAILGDLFTTSLPSMQLGMQPSFASNSAAAGLPWLGISNTLAMDSNNLPVDIPDKSLHALQTMQFLQGSIERGSYVTRSLFIPREVWQHTTTRLAALETKIRVTEMVSTALEGIDQAGAFLLEEEQKNSSVMAKHVNNFIKQLDDVEIITNEAQNLLSKKLGNFDHTPTGSTTPSAPSAGGSLKKSNLQAFNSLSSRLQRSLNQIMVSHHGNSRTGGVDSPAAYAEGLSKLFARSHTLREHLELLTQASLIYPNGYQRLTVEFQAAIESRLRKLTDFLANVVLRFALNDVHILLDKQCKRNVNALMEV